MLLVVCAFGCPLEDFAFDDAGVGALLPGGVDAAEEFCDGAFP